MQLSMKLKKFLKTYGLNFLLYAKVALPKTFTSWIFLRLTNIRLEFEEESEIETVQVCKYKYGAGGAFCISIDYDLPISKRLQTDWRLATDEILRLAEKYSIPMSWAFCGNLVLKESRVYERIKNSTASLDMGIHTFTHTDFSNPQCTVTLAREEISKSIKALKEIQKPTTFIFPWNKIAHLSLLKEYGFNTFRGNKNGKLAYPRKVQQLWDVHGSYYLVERSALEVKFILKLIDSAISYDCTLHLWSHPWDLHIGGDPGKFGKKVLDPIFKHATNKRKDGLLWICSMRELANYCEARESCTIQNLVEEKDQINFSVSCQVRDQRFIFPPTITLQVSVPRGWEDFRVLIDGEEKNFDSSCKLARQGSKSLVFLTLSFIKPNYYVSLVRKT